LFIGILAAVAVHCGPVVSPDRAGHASDARSAERDVRSSAQSLSIQLAAGSLLGKVFLGTREFLGIPYAKPPVGALRFAPPMAAEPWPGTLDATHFGPACPQPDFSMAMVGPRSEDCLTLNVYTPTKLDAPLPVMVFIPGGAFVFGGSSLYDVEGLAKAGVVVVALNYRLGALGFFSHPALDATRSDAPSGSDGIRDQQLALRWVHDNIRAFGGDPDNVTVVGESAGAISACIHWVAPSSRGLARRYILQSGTCSSDGFGVQTKENADALGKRLSEALCPGERDVLRCMRSKPAEDVVSWDAKAGLFGAGWEPAAEGRGGVLPESVEQLIANAETLTPIIIGTDKREWGVFEQLGAFKPKTKAEFASTLARTFADNAALVAVEYPVASDAEVNDVYMRLVTDVSFRCPTRSVAQLGSERGANVWMYSFEHATAYHAQELDYVFADDMMSSYGGGPPSAALTAIIQRYWTRFARTGDPNGAPDPAWPRYQTASEQYLVLDDAPITRSGLAKKHCDFWREYFAHDGTIELQ
jgi:para-nitrobenzyl esterase